MKINSDGWAEVEHAGDDLPAAMQNAIFATLKRWASEAPFPQSWQQTYGHSSRHQIIPIESWAEVVESVDVGRPRK